VAVILLLICATYFVGAPLNRVVVFVGYDNYRFFNHVQSAAVPLAILAMTVAPGRSWLRGVAWFSAIGGFALLFTAAGRGTMVGIAVGAVAIFALFERASFATLRNLAIATVLGLALFALLFWVLPLLTGMTPVFSEGYYGARLDSVQARFFLWRIAQSYIEQSPWLGIGPMHYAHFLNPEAAHPHNIYLQIAAEWGVPMLLLVAGLGVLALRKLALAVRQCSDTRQRDCGIGLFLACVAIAVDGLFSGNFVMPVSQVWIAFTFGWAMAWTTGQSATGRSVVAESSGQTSIKRIAASALLASQLWLVWSVWPEVSHMDEYVEKAMARFSGAAMNPRFWSYGWF
jgi:O-antigen ligase